MQTRDWYPRSTLVHIFFLLNLTNQENASKKHDLLTMMVMIMMMMAVPGRPWKPLLPPGVGCGVALVELGVADGDLFADEAEVPVVVGVQFSSIVKWQSKLKWPSSDRQVTEQNFTNYSRARSERNFLSEPKVRWTLTNERAPVGTCGVTLVELGVADGDLIVEVEVPVVVGEGRCCPHCLRRRRITDDLPLAKKRYL